MLYIVPTPIGNIKDITYRAIEVLKNVDYILCEDTRKTSYLLREYEISTKLIPYNAFNSNHKKHRVISDLQEKNIAIVSSAGTPGVSDPGLELIRECIESDISYTALPGATAVIPAAIMSGVVYKEFVFLGFIPNKKGRKTFIENIEDYKYPVIFYESVHRIEKCIIELDKYLTETKKITVIREISKIHEEVVKIDRQNLPKVLESTSLKKGEFVIVVNDMKK